MQSVKQISHEIADHLPEDATLDDAMQALYVRRKPARATEAAERGEVTSQEEMETKHPGDAR